MKAELWQILLSFAAHKMGGTLRALRIHATDPWNLQILFRYPEDSAFIIRSIRDGDVTELGQFATTLGPVSKDLFSPFPWDRKDELEQAYERAIQQTIDRFDAAYLMFVDEKPVGYFVLWKANGSSQSEAFGVHLPILGIAISDAYHGQGLGGLAVRILQVISRFIDADGIELTTAKTNARGWNTYLANGFEHIGTMRIPLGVDFGTLDSGVMPGRYRDERQMVYIINSGKREAILDYLELKRTKEGCPDMECLETSVCS